MPRRHAKVEVPEPAPEPRFEGAIETLLSAHDRIRETLARAKRQ